MAKQKKVNHFHIRTPFIIGLVVALGLVGSVVSYNIGYHKAAIKQAKHDSLYRLMKAQKIKGCDGIQIVSPTKGQQVTSPLTVTAIVDNRNAKCDWTVFEAQAGTLTLKNASGQTIGTGTLTTTDDWMTDEPVTYTGTITFAVEDATPKLLLRIDEENPSGHSGAAHVTLPLRY